MSILLLFGNTTLQGLTTSLFSMGAQSTTQGMISAAIGLNSHQVLIQALGQHTQSLQSLLNVLETGNPFTSRQALINKLSEEVLEAQMLINSISDSTSRAQSIRNEIIDEPVKEIQTLINRILETDYVQSNQLLLGKIGDVTSAFQSTTYNIYLDGRKITHRINYAAITCDESTVHNTIEMTSVDKRLFQLSDPFALRGESRIEVQVGSRVLYFLLEKRSGDEMNFSLWGRSLSAREDTPFADSVEYSLSSPTSAQEVAEGLPDYCSVTWECGDWVLPASFSYRGTPIEGILEIARVIGAVVRSDDDGTIIVRDRFTTRPVAMNGASADLTYGRDTLLQGLDYEEINGEGYNTINILGATADEVYPTLEIEESSPVQGDTIRVRAYWNGIYPPSAISSVMTATGVISHSIQTESVTETVEFQNGIASASYPIVLLQYTNWIGVSLGTLTADKYSTVLVPSSGISNPTAGHGIAEITYQTVYNKYELSRHDVEKLILVLTYYTGANIDILLKSMGEDDSASYEAPAISDQYLTNDAVAVLRGKNFLDQNKYDRKIFSIRAPYDDDALDGNIVFLNDGDIGCSGNFHIEVSNIVFRGPKVVNEMRVIQWQV